MSTVGFSAAGIAKVDRRGLLFASAAPFLQDGETKLRMRVIYLDHKSAARILKIVAEALKTTNSNGSAWSQAATALLYRLPESAPAQVNPFCHRSIPGPGRVGDGHDH